MLKILFGLSGTARNRAGNSGFEAEVRAGLATKAERAAEKTGDGRRSEPDWREVEHGWKAEPAGPISHKDSKGEGGF